MATLSLGTIHEADGTVERQFWLRNDGNHAVVLTQGYTSCGCTQIDYARQQAVEPGDSTSVTLRFNPRGKGGEFEEVGTVVYRSAATGQKRRQRLALTGQCITSEETLLRQFPIRISDDLRLAADRFDLGVMRQGESKERGVVVLHRSEGNRKERIPVTITIDKDTPHGLQHLKRQLTVAGQTITVTFDVMVK